MPIKKEEVQHIAKLARLGLTEKEIEKHQKEFSKILDYIEKLKEVDITKVKSTSFIYAEKNIIRGDEVLRSNKKLIDSYLKVKSIL